MKSFLTILLLLTIYDLFSQNIVKEISELHSNGSPALITYKDSELRVIKYEMYSPENTLVSYINLNPNTGKANGEFLRNGKKGIYEQGKIKQCLGCYYSLGNNLFMVGDQVDGKFKGEHKIYYSKSKTYTAQQKYTGFWVNYSTGENEQIFHSTINFNENGDINGKVLINNSTSLYFDNGKFIGYIVFNTNNPSIAKDSVFCDNQYWKIENKIINNLGALHDLKWNLFDYSNFKMEHVNLVEKDGYLSGEYKEKIYFFGNENLNSVFKEGVVLLEIDNKLDYINDIYAKRYGRLDILNSNYKDIKIEYENEIGEGFIRLIKIILQSSRDEKYELLVHNDWTKNFEKTITTENDILTEYLDAVFFLYPGDGSWAVEFPKNLFIDYVNTLITNKNILIENLGYDKWIKEIWVIENNKVIRLIETQKFKELLEYSNKRLTFYNEINLSIKKFNTSIENGNFVNSKSDLENILLIYSNNINYLDKYSKKYYFEKKIANLKLEFNTLFEKEIRTEKETEIKKLLEQSKKALEDKKFDQALLFCEEAKKFEWPRNDIQDLISSIEINRNMYNWDLFSNYCNTNNLGLNYLKLDNFIPANSNILNYFKIIEPYIFDATKSNAIFNKIDHLLNPALKNNLIANSSRFLLEEGVLITYNYDKKPLEPWLIDLETLKLAHKTYKDKTFSDKWKPFIFYSLKDNKFYFFPFGLWPKNGEANIDKTLKKIIENGFTELNSFSNYYSTLNIQCAVKIID
jgi:hypothetical protein